MLILRLLYTGKLSASKRFSVSSTGLLIMLIANGETSAHYGGGNPVGNLIKYQIIIIPYNESYNLNTLLNKPVETILG